MKYFENPLNSSFKLFYSIDEKEQIIELVTDLFNQIKKENKIDSLKKYSDLMIEDLKKIIYENKTIEINSNYLTSLHFYNENNPKCNLLQFKTNIFKTKSSEETYNDYLKNPLEKIIEKYHLEKV